MPQEIEQDSSTWLLQVLCLHLYPYNKTLSPPFFALIIICYKGSKSPICYRSKSSAYIYSCPDWLVNKYPYQIHIAAQFLSLLSHYYFPKIMHYNPICNALSTVYRRYRFNFGHPHVAQCFSEPALFSNSTSS